MSPATGATPRSRGCRNRTSADVGAALRKNVPEARETITWEYKSLPYRQVDKSSAPESEASSDYDKYITKIDDATYEVDSRWLGELFDNPGKIAKGARIVPSIKNGKPNGFKLYAIRPSSVYAAIGLKNGDTINMINGFDLTTPDKALDVYTKVRSATEISIALTRRGKSVILLYKVK